MEHVLENIKSGLFQLQPATTMNTSFKKTEDISNQVNVTEEMKYQSSLTPITEEASEFETNQKSVPIDSDFETAIKSLAERREKLLANKSKVEKYKHFLKERKEKQTDMVENCNLNSTIPPPPPPPPALSPSNVPAVSKISATLKADTTTTTESKTSKPKIAPSILNNPIRNLLLEQFRLQVELEEGMVTKEELTEKKPVHSKLHGLPVLRVPSVNDPEHEFYLVSHLEPQSLNGNEQKSGSWFGWLWFW